MSLTEVDPITLYHRRLLKSEKCLEYLRRRRIKAESTVTFGIGYHDTSAYSAYHDRMMFPIRDQYGELLSFQGRAMYDWGAEGRPKYYHGDGDWKGSVVYGLYECGKQAFQKGYCVLVEGPFDMIACYQAGYPAVCMLGSAFSFWQCLVLRRFVDEVIVWTDSDDAGDKSFESTKVNAKKAGIRTYRAMPTIHDQRFLSFGAKDPSDLYASHGAEAVREVIEACR